MKIATHSLLIACILLGAAPQAAAQAERPCDGPKGGEFDFWIGEWDLSWPGGQGGTPEGERGSGSNVITKILAECVILENFTSDNFTGMSVSTVKRQTGNWHQTWVDSQGGYLTFEGGFQDGDMDLRTAPFENASGDRQINRMLWTNIRDDSLDWHWQRSLDDGATWEDLWVIRYVRR